MAGCCDCPSLILFSFIQAVAPFLNLHKYENPLHKNQRGYELDTLNFWLPPNLVFCWDFMMSYFLLLEFGETHANVMLLFIWPQTLKYVPFVTVNVSGSHLINQNIANKTLPSIIFQLLELYLYTLYETVNFSR